MADPRRIVQARQQLHLGQMVQFWEWGTGKLRPARIVSMKDSQVTLLDEQSQHRISVSYAAIVLDQDQAGASGSNTPGSTASAPPPFTATAGHGGSPSHCSSASST